MGEKKKILIVKHGNSWRIGTRKQKIAGTQKNLNYLTTAAESAQIWTLIGAHRLLSILLLHDLDLSWVMVYAEYLGEWQPWWANLGLISQRIGSSLGKLFFEWLKIESSLGEEVAWVFNLLRLGLYVTLKREDVLQWGGTDWCMRLKWEFHETEMGSWMAPRIVF